METIKNIPGYDGRYKISKDGKVFSFFPDGRILELKQYFGKSGHKIVSLHYSGGKDFNPKSFVKTIASLILEAWGPPKPGSEYRATFKDGDKNNVHLDNLKWGTKSEIMTKTLSRIGMTMNRKPQKRVIVVIDGINNANKILNYRVNFIMDKGYKNRDGYLVFSPEGYEKWKNNGCGNAEDVKDL